VRAGFKTREEAMGLLGRVYDEVHLLRGELGGAPLRGQLAVEVHNFILALLELLVQPRH